MFLEESLMASLPWPIEEPPGVHIGSALDELTIRRFNLHRQHEMEEDDDEWWTSADDEISLIVVRDVIALVNHRESAVIGGADLIGVDQFDVARVLGPPHEIGAEDWIYQVHPWKLSVGFFEDRVSWITLSHDDLLDDEHASQS